jgi:ubiquinone/menaquinone biosynthesis C-methylase UbiE
MMVRKIDTTYLKLTAQTPAIRAIKARAYELLELRAGNQVVDIGCGPAIDTIPMARLVGPTGMVLGVDNDPEMVKEANGRATREGVGAFTRHVVCDATNVTLPSGTVDACFCERVLQHVPWIEAQKVTSEIIRIVRQGGHVAVIDTDWGTLSIAAEDPWLERRIVQEHVLGFANPFSGRHLPALFRTSGLVEMSVETFNLQLAFEPLEFLLGSTLQRGIATGRIGAGEAQRWSQGLRWAREYGLFFAHVSMVLVAGRKD